MTRQTTAPLPVYGLNGSTRSVRDIVRGMVPQMEMNPPYQRGPVWSYDQRIGLVRSWIMRVPVPAVIIDDRSSYNWTGPDPYDGNLPIWAVVDGKQRLETAVAWFTDELAVPASWFPPICDGHTSRSGRSLRHLSRIESARPTIHGQ